jgi:very-short-patch-repair endonuclease
MPPLKSKDWYEEKYRIEDRSTYEIAEMLHTYPNKINRDLKHYNIPLKDKSAAQSAAIKRGRCEHPTKGKIRPQEYRERLSEIVSRAWEEMSPEEKAVRSEIGKKQWNAMSHEEKQWLRHVAAVAVRKAAVEGSKLEKFLLSELQKAGFVVLFHKEGLFPYHEMHVDLYLPDQKIAVEIDGPSHFYPIWGQEAFERRVRLDQEKTGLLLNSGHRIIRIKYLSRSLSKKQQRDLITEVVQALNSNQQFIEIEVGDGRRF